MAQSFSLGIEFSTQSVKLVLLDLKENNVCLNETLSYDLEFPKYCTKGGVLPSDSGEIRHTSPLMLIEALDLAFKRLSDRGTDMSEIGAIKVDGMQHCTVYVNSLFEKILKNPDPAQDLVDQLRCAISRPSSPIWEDRSTVNEALYLTKALESPEGGIVNLTGNRAELRFPASQILKWAKENSNEYLNTSHIFILSSFITSILTGRIAPVDTGDGWGSNLNSLDINNPSWSSDVTGVIDDFLGENNISESIKDKLGRMDHYDSVSGLVSPYFSSKYGIDSKTVVITGTGDNPATLMGCGGNIVISLGSSYTVNGVMEEIIPSQNGEYNVFGYTRGKAMALSVITNGGKVQDHFLRKYLNISKNTALKTSDWAKFLQLAGSPLLSSSEKLMLPYLLDESVPLKKRGIIRDNFSETSAKDNIRSLILSQVLSIRLHSSHLNNVKELCVAGGGAGNPLMMQWIADAFNSDTYSMENHSVAAPLGCAISGAVCLLNITCEEAAERFIKKDSASVKKPIPENVALMDILINRYHELENLPA